jgi:hypothetical protein
MNKKEKIFFEELLDMYEFETYKNENGKLQLNDLQGACLGGICGEEFSNEYEILERMEIYHDDYILRILEEDYDISFDTYQEWYDFLKDKNDKKDYFELNLFSLILYKKLYTENY